MINLAKTPRRTRNMPHREEVVLSTSFFDGHKFVDTKGIQDRPLISGKAINADGVSWGKTNMANPDILLGDGTKLTVMKWAKITDVTSKRMFNAIYDTGLDKRSFYMKFLTTGDFQVVISDDGTANEGHIKWYAVETDFTDVEALFGFTFDNGVLKLFVNGVEQTVTKINDYSITAIFHENIAQYTSNCSLNNEVAVLQFLGKSYGDFICTKAFTVAEMLEFYKTATIPTAKKDYVTLHAKTTEGNGSVVHDCSGNNAHIYLQDYNLNTVWTEQIKRNYPNIEGYNLYSYNETTEEYTLDNDGGTVVMPVSLNDSKKDALGSDLLYVDRAKYNITLVNSNCLTLNGTDNYIDLGEKPVNSEDWYWETVGKFNAILDSLWNGSRNDDGSQRFAWGSQQGHWYLGYKDDGTSCDIDTDTDLHKFKITGNGKFYIADWNNSKKEWTEYILLVDKSNATGSLSSKNLWLGAANYNIPNHCDFDYYYTKIHKTDGTEILIPMSMGSGSNVYDTNGESYAVNGTTSAIWDNTQEVYHYNNTYGFTKDSMTGILLPKDFYFHQLPNGVTDNVDVQNVSRVYELKADDIISLATGITNYDFVTITRSNLTGIFTQEAGLTPLKHIIENFVANAFYSGGSFVDTLDYVNTYIDSASASSSIILFVQKGLYADIAEAKTGLAGTKIIYQLATPIATTPADDGTFTDYNQSGKDFLPCESKIKLAKTTELIDADPLNYFFDENGDPIEKGYEEMEHNHGDYYFQRGQGFDDDIPATDFINRMTLYKQAQSEATVNRIAKILRW